MNPVGGVVRGLLTRSLREGRSSGIECLGHTVDTMRKTNVVGGTNSQPFPFRQGVALHDYRLVMVTSISYPATVDISRYPGMVRIGGTKAYGPAATFE